MCIARDVILCPHLAFCSETQPMDLEGQQCSVQSFRVFKLIVREARFRTGNSPGSTFANAEALCVLDHVALHSASFTNTCSFYNNPFALVTSSLALHAVSAHEKEVAAAELVRVAASGGRIIILELMGYAHGYKETLRNVCAWQDVEVSTSSAEVKFGA